MIVESAELVAKLKQEVAKAKDLLNKHVKETAQRMDAKASKVHNLNEALIILKEKNAEVVHYTTHGVSRAPHQPLLHSSPMCTLSNCNPIRCC